MVVLGCTWAVVFHTDGAQVGEGWVRACGGGSVKWMQQVAMYGMLLPGPSTAWEGR